MTVSRFAESDVLIVCAQYGAHLNVPTDLDGSTVMRAIASNESSLGFNCGPRHEPAYDVGGLYASSPPMPALLTEWGVSAASSYGPWQMMYCNYSGAYTPPDLLTDLQANATEFVRYFNNYVASRAASLSDIGQIWNSGHVAANPSPAVAAYVTKLQAAYDAAIAAQGGT